MLGFSHVLKPIKRQNLLENGKKNSRDAFPTGAKMISSSILSLNFSETGANSGLLDQCCACQLFKKLMLSQDESLIFELTDKY